MIIARYGRRPRHATHALSAAAEECSFDVRVPEMIAESLSIGRLSACLHIASTAPALSISFCSQQRRATGGSKKPDCLMPKVCNHRLHSRAIDLHICLFFLWYVVLGSPLLTFLSHFAFAFAQCTQAIGIRSGDSMPWTDRSRTRREAPLGRMCKRSGRPLSWLWSVGITRWERPGGQSGGVRGGSAISGV